MDLPEYRTHGGVHASDRRVTAPPIMWVKALDMLMEKLRILGVDFSKVAAISGAGQVRMCDQSTELKGIELALTSELVEKA